MIDNSESKIEIIRYIFDIHNLRNDQIMKS